MRKILILLFSAAACGGCSRSTASDPGGRASELPDPFAKGAGVLTRSYDLQRTGATLGETVLTADLVGSSHFGKQYCQPVDDEIYASILYVPRIDFGARGRHDAVYVATMGDSLYAFDALAPGAPLWEKHYADSTPGAAVVPTPSSDLARGTCGNYKDISLRVGILSTPAIDPESKTMYFLARTRENGIHVQRLHAVDLADGGERPGSPVAIAFSAPGTGAGAITGVIGFDPLRQNQRAALLLHQGVVYIAWSSHCDEGPYHGWIAGYDARSLQLSVLFNDTPTGTQGGIWMSGQGPAVDPNDGSLYVISGNGTADLVTPGPNRGQSFMKLKRQGDTLAVVDWFTPWNYAVIDRQDRDLGASGPMLVPGTNLLIGGSKEGKLYVIDRANMGKYQAVGDDQIVQTIVLSTSRAHNHGTPVYWKNAVADYVYVMAEEDNLKQFSLINGSLQLVQVSAFKAPTDPGPRPGGYTMPGGFLAVSANGDRDGIVWVSVPVARDSNQAVVPGVLLAFDANDISRQLWTSEQTSARDSYGNFAKFNPPTIYNGRVYQPTFSNQYCVYGKLE